MPKMCKPDTKGSELANEYCQSIVQEVLALEKLLANHESFDDELEDSLREFWIELAESADEEPSCYEPSVFDYVNLYCLEFTTLGERSNAINEWNVVGARLLRTYGGPNAFIEWNDTDFIVVQVYWGSEFAEARLFAPNIATCLEEMADAVC
ncbi:MAG: hypothetical protein ACYDB2_07660 [Acidimicrobiales bacterium]